MLPLAFLSTLPTDRTTTTPHPSALATTPSVSAASTPSAATRPMTWGELINSPAIKPGKKHLREIGFFNTLESFYGDTGKAAEQPMGNLSFENYSRLFFILDQNLALIENKIKHDATKKKQTGASTLLTRSALFSLKDEINKLLKAAEAREKKSASSSLSLAHTTPSSISSSAVASFPMSTANMPGDDDQKIPLDNPANTNTTSTLPYPQPDRRPDFTSSNLFLNSSGSNPLFALINTPISTSQSLSELIDTTMSLSGNDVNFKDDNGDTALHFFIYRGDFDAAKMLVKYHGANVLLQNKAGKTAEEEARYYQQIKIANWLSTRKGHVANNSKAGNNPLHTALLNPNASLAEIQKIVSQQGINVNTANNEGYTPLFFAVRIGNLDIVKYLIERCGANINIPRAKHPLLINMLLFFKPSTWGSQHSAVLAYLLETQNQDININQTDVNGNTILHHAAVNTDHTTVQYLVRTQHANLFIRNKDGKTAYDLAEGEPSTEKYLKKEMDMVKKKETDQSTALHVQCQRGEIDKLNFLIAQKADVNALNQNQSTPLFRLVRTGKLDAIRFLIENGAKTNLFGLNDVSLIANIIIETDKPLVSHKDPTKAIDLRKVIHYLLSLPGADINQKNLYGHTALHIAAMYGKFEWAQFLINECNANIFLLNEAKRTPQRLAVKNEKDALQNHARHLKHQEMQKALKDEKKAKGCKKIVELLETQMKIHKQTYEDNQKNFRLNELIDDDVTLDAVKACIASGAPTQLIDKEGYTPLDKAIIAGKLAVVKHLIETCHVPIDTFNKHHRNALMEAAFNDKKSIVTYLLTRTVPGKTKPEESKSNETISMINVVNSHGDTALHYAAAAGHDNIVDELLKHQVKTNIFNNALRNPLMTAMVYRQEAVFKNLAIAMREQVNNPNNDGTTPLHLAVYLRDLKMVKFLTDLCKADLNVKNKQGKTPLAEARKLGYFAITRHLEIQHRKKTNQPLAAQNVLDQRNTQLHNAVAADKGDQAINQVKNFILENPNRINTPNINGDTPTHWVMRFNHIECFKLFMHHADLSLRNEQGYTPVQEAIIADSSKIIEQLLSAKVIEARDMPELFFLAAGKGAIKTVKLFFDQFFIDPRDINEVKADETHLTIQEQDAAKKSLDINIKGQPENETVLHWAAREIVESSTTSVDKKIEVLRFLIDKGVDVNAATRSGETALEQAFMMENHDVVKWLLENTHAQVNNPFINKELAEWSELKGIKRPALLITENSANTIDVISSKPDNAKPSALKKHPKTFVSVDFNEDKGDNSDQDSDDDNTAKEQNLNKVLYDDTSTVASMAPYRPKPGDSAPGKTAFFQPQPDDNEEVEVLTLEAVIKEEAHSQSSTLEMVNQEKVHPKSPTLS